MKPTIIASTVIASALFSGFAYSATVKGGTVSFQGSVTSGTCAVDYRNQVVDLGEVRAADFKKVGDISAPTEFKISLLDCDASITTSAIQGASATAAISFYGPQDPSKADILALTGIGSSKGLGIIIEDSESRKPVTLDNKPGTAKTLHNGQNDISFNARFISTDATVTAGKANATVNFSVTYQ